jgi:hypothetical protein
VDAVEEMCRMGGVAQLDLVKEWLSESFHKKGFAVKEPKKVEKISIKDLTIEEGSKEILTSPNMQPYMQLAMMVVQQQDPKEALELISKLPLGNRYIWRIASALKWAFCDFDSISVEADRATLEEADLKKLLELLQLRPVQFCMFLKALLGQEEMERIMLDALAMAKGD